MKFISFSILLLTLVASAERSSSYADVLRDAIDQQAKAVENKMIAWRRDIHEHPELGNREFRTSALVAEHLKSLGYEVREKVAHTGVIAVLKGGKPGPVIAFRADMDALPVTEEVDLPFASKIKAMWDGRETGVMHACGHDAHTAILMAAAEVFARMRGELPGMVKLIFQPAEETPPPGEEGGAALMIKEGALDNPRPDAIFGLHVIAPAPAGIILIVPARPWLARTFSASPSEDAAPMARCPGKASIRSCLHHRSCSPCRPSKADRWTSPVLPRF